jgi:hypothetical protein
MALPDRASQVLDRMVQKALGERPMMLICHSLGGLLAKQLLRKATDSPDPRKQQVASQARAVLFLATPHAGARLASLADAFRAVFGATVSIEDLREHDAHLRDLYDWYRNHASRLGIETVTYFESRSVKGVLPIVSPTSAHPGVGQDPVPLDEDHLSIAKPREPDAQVCDAARCLLRNHVLAPRPAASFEPQTLHARAREETQDRLRQMQGRFRERNFWKEVYGLSGGTDATEQLSAWALKRLIREGWGNDKALECRVHDLDMLNLGEDDRKDQQKVTAADQRVLELLQSLGMATGRARSGPTS